MGNEYSFSVKRSESIEAKKDRNKQGKWQKKQTYGHKYL